MRHTKPALAFAIAVAITPPATAGSSEPLSLRTLSNRADLISGGQALVEVEIPPVADPEALQLHLNGSDVSSSFQPRPDGRILGLLTGLMEGENILVASLPDTDPVALIINNHDSAGPVFSGPQVQPWACETEAAGLGAALDDACSAPARQELLHWTGSEFEPYDPADPPDSVASTTTDEGRTVPYIVLRETGTINRGIYQFAVLVDPAQQYAPWDPPRGYNHKLLYGFEGGAGCEHKQGSIEYDVLYDRALSKGFAVASSTLNRLVQNCNTAVSAETVMMIKELLVERFGEIRYTIGTGSSGGGLQQQVIAGAYPGLLDAISPGASFMDAITTMVEIADCSLLERVFNVASPHLWVAEPQRAAVQGHQSITPCEYWTTIGRYDKEFIDPRVGCGFSNATWIYHPTRNPTGVRCTAQDFMRSIYGVRAQDGFAHSPHDNVGLQYGLRALESGEITPEQFVDLNEKVGGFDIDGNWVPRRTEADPAALAISYRAGVLNTGKEMAKVPVIDRRSPPVNHDIHASFRSWAMRARLVEQNGHHDNQVIWIQGTESRAFETNDTWLSNIERDHRAVPIQQKVLDAKPAGVADACWVQSRQLALADCEPAFPHYADPRIAAGGPDGDDVLKCTTAPLDRSTYAIRVDGEPVAPIVFTDAQWARLQAAFPTGVCDFSQPGIGEQETVPWLSFSSGPGGEPVGDPPVSSPFAWEQCDDGQVASGSTPTGAGLRLGGTPPNATRLIVCSKGPAPFTGAIILRADPQNTNAYVDITGDEASAMPCSKGFSRVRVQDDGPRFYSSQHGSYEDTDPATPGAQGASQQTPDEWAATMLARCTR